MWCYLQPARDLKIAQKLALNETIRLPARTFTLMYEGAEPVRRNLNFLALVINFHRERDHKRFVHIEPFSFVNFNDGNKKIVPVYASPPWAVSGPSHFFLEVLKQITDTEKILFMAN
jgi:hypothetical protein